MSDFSTEHMHLVDEHCNMMFMVEKSVFISCSPLPKEQRAILETFSIAMLYSIWEGFAQKSFAMYVDYIKSQNITYDKLIDSLIIYVMETNFNQFICYPTKDNKKISFYKNLYNFCRHDVCDIPMCINTKGNVGLAVFNSLLLTFGLQPISSCWGIYKHPNPNLENMLSTFLRYRNSIAHGGDITSEEIVTQDVYNKYRTLIRDLMYYLHEELVYGVCNKTFIKHI